MAATKSDTRILLADDVVVNTMIVVRQLKKLGFDADVVHDGHAAVDAWARGGYDLVLMDCHMPGMDGYEATAEIRRREGPVRRTRIIALTASALEVDRDQSLAAGMDDHITKPVKAEVLGTLLARWLAPPVER